MDLGDTASLAAAIIALLALGISIWSAIISTKNLTASNRSATAAEVSASAARRSADADEAMVELAKGEADDVEVPWHLIPAGKSYRLMNNSDKPAENVHIEGSVIAVNFENGDTIRGRSSVRILDVRSIADNDPLTVTWTKPGSPDERLGPWTHPL